MGPHPDSNIYPEASGLAKLTVDKHSEEQPLKLYAGWFCPFVQRVWMALEEKQIPYQYIEVNPYDKPASLLELNPRGLVPTLSCPQSDGSPSRPLYESNVVIEYLDEAYPDTPRLLPTDPYQRARTRIWIDFVTSRLLPSFYRLLQCDNLDDAKLAETRKELLDNLKKFTVEMDSKGPFFNGEEIGMPDLVFAPWAAKFGLYETLKNGGVGIPVEGSGGEDEAVWGRWRVWIGAVKERKSLRETQSEDKHYLPMAKRYADNLAQSELAKAIRAGKSVP